MDLRRVRPGRAGGGYDADLRDILGSPGRREVDALALVWAHTIAWAAHADRHRDELKLLSQAAKRYSLPLDLVLEERRRQQSAPPIVPANRRGEPEPPEALDLPA